jgi:hypothetical protein
LTTFTSLIAAQTSLLDTLAGRQASSLETKGSVSVVDGLQELIDLMFHDMWKHLLQRCVIMINCGLVRRQTAYIAQMSANMPNRSSSKLLAAFLGSPFNRRSS